MKLINKVTEESYIQWIEEFVLDVISRTDIVCNEIIIEDIEFSKRIFLIADGEEYIIRTWNFHPAAKDRNGRICAEMVDYTLYKMIIDDNGDGHGEEIIEGRLRIDWDNV